MTSMMETEPSRRMTLCSPMPRGVPGSVNAFCTSDSSTALSAGRISDQTVWASCSYVSVGHARCMVFVPSGSSGGLDGR